MERTTWTLRRIHVAWHAYGGCIRTVGDAEADQVMIPGCFQRIELRVHVLRGGELGLSLAYDAVVTRAETWSHIGSIPHDLHRHFLSSLIL
jgi:hypothetical protein